MDDSEVTDDRGLKGHPSSTHSALIVSKPYNTDVYYIFTEDHPFAEANGIQYSEVDMASDGEL